MLFRVIAAVASVAFISQVALSQPTVENFVDLIGRVTNVSRSDIVLEFIDSVTDTTENANNTLSQITSKTNLPQIQTGVQILGDAVVRINAVVQTYVDTAAYNGSFTNCTETVPIIDALGGFVRVHQALMSTFIDKRSIFAGSSLTARILGLLEDFKHIIDHFASATVRMMEQCNVRDAYIAQLRLDTFGRVAVLLYKVCDLSPPSCMITYKIPYVTA